MSTGIRFIYFDIGGVLLRWRQSVADLAKHYDRHPDEFERVLKRYDIHFSRGGFSETDMWGVFKTLLMLEEKEDFDFNDFTTDSFSAIDPMHDLVRQLAGDYSLGLLTNIYPGTFDRIVQKGCIPSVSYKAVIKSCEVGCAKPDRKIYEIAREKAAVDHHEILFVDDLKENLKPAQLLGWSTYQFDEHKPDESVSQIREILKL